MNDFKHSMHILLKIVEKLALIISLIPTYVRLLEFRMNAVLFEANAEPHSSIMFIIFKYSIKVSIIAPKNYSLY